MKQKKTTNRVWMGIVLMLAAVSTISAQGNVSLRLTDEPLPKALRLIERQGGKSIIFSVSETEKYKVNADIRDTTQAGAINHVLWGKPFVAKEREEYFVVQKQENKNTSVGISGVVVDEKGEPIPSCNVLLFSTDTIFLAGTITDSDGVFNIETKKTSSICFKCLSSVTRRSVGSANREILAKRYCILTIQSLKILLSKQVKNIRMP